MGVLESPITWIVVAAVLVVIAILLLVLSAARRRRARRAAAAAAWPPPALEASRPNPDAPWSGPTPLPEERVRVTTRSAVSNVSGRAEAAAATRYAEPDTAPLDVDTIRARLAAELAKDGTTGDQPEEQPAEDRSASLFRPYAPSVPAGASATGDHAPARARHAAADAAGETDAPDTGEDAAESTDSTDTTEGPYATAPAARPPTPPAGTPIAPPTPTEPDTTAETPTSESAKDRLLGVLLRDPRAAVAALEAAGRGEDAAPGEGDVTALLRAGLSPAQVARLVGVDERDLATVVARGLGLLPAQASGGDVSTGENRTDDPGRSWANTASSAGSTTPTTG
ncbi:hypothetical protein EV188_10779 [Actinomycetospora succinea]|uniref:Uncharacterized protein n=1 Tax=Actinomycetospora succinea TaxID=663603 RepID=A0A4R6V272_9PSEU|nr:hypothetical protein [Actinomycetospora succinea]TDQ52703.1 hypothetical protein EV188_10779 [Actinomycetospora succinea]